MSCKERALLASNQPTTTRRQGSDQDTRRRCACDLVRALCQQFDEAVTAVCLEYIGNMVQLYATNPAAWRSKDAAVALMLAVTVRAESAAKGASMLNERVDVMGFFTSHVSEGVGPWAWVGWRAR